MTHELPLMTAPPEQAASRQCTTGGGGGSTSTEVRPSGVIGGSSEVRPSVGRGSDFEGDFELRTGDHELRHGDRELRTGDWNLPGDWHLPSCSQVDEATIDEIEGAPGGALRLER